MIRYVIRTESGGLSFDAIHRIMELCPSACDGSVLVVPDSSKGACGSVGVNGTQEIEGGVHVPGGVFPLLLLLLLVGG